MVLRKTLIALLALASLVAAESATGLAANVTLFERRFNPRVSTIQHGVGVSWTNTDDEAHTAKDRTTLHEFEVSVPSPGFTTTAFNYAGIYPYLCTIHPRVMRGVMRVTMSSVPTTNTVGQNVNVRWGSIAPPPSRSFDVQVLRPGATRWRTFANDTTSAGQDFLLNKRGTFRFRAIQHGMPGSGIRGRFSPVLKVIATAP